MYSLSIRTLALILAALASPMPFAAVADSTPQTQRVGVQVKIETLTPQDADAIARSGFSFVRFGIWTNQLDDAAYRRRVASAFDVAARAKLPVLLTMRSTAPLVDEATRDTAPMISAGKRFGAQVTQIARQYASQLVGIELWNEPDLSRYWPTGDIARTFPAFMQGVCSGLKAASRTVPIYGFGFSRAPVGNNLPSRLTLSVLTTSPHCIDAISYHAYGMTPPEIRNAADDIGSKYAMPAVITEWGVPSDGSATSNATLQASRIRSFLASIRSLDASLISVYEWKDTASGRTARERSFGLVDATGAEKPALRTVRDYFGAAASGTP
ncbi:cellulase family glycosylhydrolase [Caballeronia sp. ATUFL_M2_KS44]|uniref:cellulase family glycosylhydrolase n=1 Tax=Caballeronia sp. ATUFL_M2_KS44 TaxID=2921767 RepID=UPI0020281037|nr:cellulase family glycosylhydrolase [Caballeronia sp. ATUFL_M2_KS44]